MRISLAYGVQTQCSGLCRPFSLLRTQGQTFCRLVAGHEPRRVLWFYTACTWKNGSCVLKMTYVYYYFFLFIPLVTPLFWLHPVTTVFYVLTNLPILCDTTLSPNKGLRGLVGAERQKPEQSTSELSVTLEKNHALYMKGKEMTNRLHLTSGPTAVRRQFGRLQQCSTIYHGSLKAWDTQKGTRADMWGVWYQVAPVSLSMAYLGLRTHRTARPVVLAAYRNGNVMLTFHAPVINRVLLLMPSNMF
ncbi:hypothetical protein BGW80DRAFT_1282851 [Lactifluus volemus]|nr:hypothetical protein BGW80DRAFT_1282851 [Lactifluus volemus]